MTRLNRNQVVEILRLVCCENVVAVVVMRSVVTLCVITADALTL